MTEKERDVIKLSENYNRKEIAKTLNLSYSSVAYILRKYDIQLKRKPYKKKYSKDVVKNIAYDISIGTTGNEVAKKNGVSKQLISYVLNRENYHHVWIDDKTYKNLFSTKD